MAAQSNRIEGTASSVYCSLIIRVSSALVVALGILIGAIQPGLALSENELYEFCSKYPNNTQCEGRGMIFQFRSVAEPEKKDSALSISKEIALADRCKVLLGEENLTVYFEQGEAVALLGNERRTEEFSVEFNSITALTYREDEFVNQNRVARNTLLFGLLGALFTQPDEVSQVEIQFADTTAMVEDNGVTDSVEAIAPTSEPPSSGSLVFETSRQQGRSMSENLEQLTGLPAQISF